MQVLCDVWDASPEDEYVKKTNKDIVETIELEEKKELRRRDEWAQMGNNNPKERPMSNNGNNPFNRQQHNPQNARAAIRLPMDGARAHHSVVSAKTIREKK